ncbi:MAG: hypothetical protein Q8891_00905 [Bacteroidota bacterium]|nr:hypothetical protein [Bacteroidota bacterium]
MRTLLSILTIVFLNASCATQGSKAVHSDNKFDVLPLPLDSTVFYFKAKSNWKDTTKDALDTFVNTWYSKMLFALKEPILKCYQGDKEIYRFTWLRTFHHPVSIRLEKQGEIIKLFTKVCNGAGGYFPGQILFDTAINITINEYNLLIQKINAMGFWNLATEKRDEDGKDGSEWIIEIFKDNKYHMVTRWTPSEKRQGNFRSVGEYLVSLSKISKDETKNFY